METLILLVVLEEVVLALRVALRERARGARRHQQLIRPALQFDWRCQQHSFTRLKRSAISGVNSIL